MLVHAGLEERCAGLKKQFPARRLIAAGRVADVDACLRLDTTNLVPRYVPNVDKIVGDRR